MKGVSLPPVPLYDILTERVIDKVSRVEFRREQRTRVPGWVNQYATEHNEHYIIAGTNSITDMTTKTKYLSQWPFTYGEIAREYMELCQDESGIRLQRQKLTQRAWAPVYFVGPSTGTYAYVDIRGAYYNLYRHLTLDSSYRQPEVALGSIPFISIKEFGLSKPIRNLFFGIMCKRKSDVFRNGNFDMVRSNFPSSRPDVTTYVFHTIQAIAQEAISLFKIHMWLTDAAILPASEADAFIRYLAEEWFLDSRIVAEGTSSLLATGCYQVGEKLSRNFTANVAHKGAACNLLMPKIDVQGLKEVRKWLLLASESVRTNWTGSEN